MLLSEAAVAALNESAARSIMEATFIVFCDE
jgi:hypothetical protein